MLTCGHLFWITLNCYYSFTGWVTSNMQDPGHCRWEWTSIHPKLTYISTKGGNEQSFEKYSSGQNYKRNGLIMFSISCTLNLRPPTIENSEKLHDCCSLLEERNKKEICWDCFKPGDAAGTDFSIFYYQISNLLRFLHLLPYLDG